MRAADIMRTNTGTPSAAKHMMPALHLLPACTKQDDVCMLVAAVDQNSSSLHHSRAKNTVCTRNAHLDHNPRALCASQACLLYTPSTPAITTQQTQPRPYLASTETHTLQTYAHDPCCQHHDTPSLAPTDRTPVHGRATCLCTTVPAEAPTAIPDPVVHLPYRSPRQADHRRRYCPQTQPHVCCCHLLRTPSTIPQGHIKTLLVTVTVMVTGHRSHGQS